MIIHHSRRAFRVQDDFYAFISVVVVVHLVVTVAAVSLVAFAHFDMMLIGGFNTSWIRVCLFHFNSTSA
jgi:hypothetical protein